MTLLSKRNILLSDMERLFGKSAHDGRQGGKRTGYRQPRKRNGVDERRALPQMSGRARTRNAFCNAFGKQEGRERRTGVNAMRVGRARLPSHRGRDNPIRAGP